MIMIWNIIRHNNILYNQIYNNFLIKINIFYLLLLYKERERSYYLYIIHYYNILYLYIINVLYYYFSYIRY